MELKIIIECMECQKAKRIIKRQRPKQTNTIFKFCNNNTVAFPELLDYVYDEKPLRTKV